MAIEDCGDDFGVCFVAMSAANWMSFGGAGVLCDVDVNIT